MRHVDDGRFIWARMREGGQTRATIAFLADMVPSAVARAAGRMGGGTSLDNAIRYGAMADTEWILLDMDPYFGSGGYLHGAARVWAEDGTLVAVASQTASAMVIRGQVQNATGAVTVVADRLSKLDMRVASRSRDFR